MTLKTSYTLLAPVYDLVVEHATRSARRTSLERLQNGGEVLLTGIGSGLDIPFLPPGNRYTGIDLTPAMLERARRRLAERPAHNRPDVRLIEADALRLPFADACFDSVVMHLILAVVPRPEHALAEAARVVRPGGRILILDKFLQPGQRAPLRRLANLLMRHIATRTDVVFEDCLAVCPELSRVDDRPALAGGWFRHIELHRKT